MAAQATGRVLDLGDWSDHLGSYRAGAEVGEVVRGDDPSELADDGGFDTIVSLVRTPLVADLGGYVAALLDLLADDGRLAFLEPVRRPGWGGGTLALSGRFARAAGGLYLDRDLPHELRELGLVVIDLHRFEVPSVSAPFRPFVEAWARRPVSP